MKTKIASILSAIFIILIMPISLLIVGFFTPAQFSETYYGALSPMYEKLKDSERKKIIIVGASSVPFGIDSALAEQKLNEAGADYDVINFGLYGAIGSKVMLDLAFDHIGEGDILIYAPEPHEQCMSLYFSANEFWYAADSDFSLLFNVGEDNKDAVVGAFIGYTSSKYKYIVAGKEAEGSGIYARSSFDENMDLKNYDRRQNIMAGGVDKVNPITLDMSKVSEEYIKYVNDYFDRIRKKGAVPLMSFPAMNREGIETDNLEKTVEEYYYFIENNFKGEILANPYSCIMDKEWFYDSNFHLNESGMTVFTVSLINNIKNYLGINVKTDVDLPEKPEISQGAVDNPDATGDNSMVDYFNYEETSEGYVIVGVKEDRSLPTSVIVPMSYNGKKVITFNSDVFAGNTEIVEITLQKNISSIKNDSFNGCTALEKIFIKETDPTKISIGHGLLNGADLCFIYVEENCLSSFIGNYFWRVYADKTRAV